MAIGMATTKVTVTLPDDQITEIRSLIGAGQASSVSGFVQHAVAVALADAAGWQEMLQEALDQTGGPLTQKERVWADRLLKGGRPSRSARKGKAA
jgi:Arc/MetJ-type ribon-helix-helix transcriptional regulator